MVAIAEKNNGDNPWFGFFSAPFQNKGCKPALLTLLQKIP